MPSAKSSRGLRVSVITLGCDKNTVDTERYVAQLADRGAEYTERMDEADVIVVNTCGFIDAAKKESIDALVEAGRLKDEGSCKAVVGVGCMVQRHKGELIEALPEVDLFLGSSEMDRLIPELEERGLIGELDVPVVHPGVRMFAGGLPHVRYLKISEGCDHGCAFCAIPLMRGKHRSFALDEIVAEAQLLEAQGAREINLVAQDLAHYGRDRRDDKLGLPEVLERARRAKRRSRGFACSTSTRPGSRRGCSSSWRRSRASCRTSTCRFSTRRTRCSRACVAPSVSARFARRSPEFAPSCPMSPFARRASSAFPGETDEDFETLLAFLEEIQFDRVGAFTYSPQEGTRAAEMEDDVPESVKRERLERLNEVQRLITAERYEARVGRVVRALVDRVDDGAVQARTAWQADDIDGVTYIRDAAGVAPGTFVDVELEEVIDDVDFGASLVSVVSAPAPRAREARALPVLGSIGSFGR